MLHVCLAHVHTPALAAAEPAPPCSPPPRLRLPPTDIQNYWEGLSRWTLITVGLSKLTGIDITSVKRNANCVARTPGEGACGRPAGDMGHPCQGLQGGTNKNDMQRRSSRSLR